jgi:hypothetical protein
MLQGEFSNGDTVVVDALDLTDDSRETELVFAVVKPESQPA